MQDVAIVSYESLIAGEGIEPTDIELVNPVVMAAIERSGVDPRVDGVTISGASDYIAGISFSFLWVLDAIGAAPSIAWSHVEMDAAWAFYEAWVRLQSGEADTALVFGFGTPTHGDTSGVLGLQLDPYYVAPLGLGSLGASALQAQTMIDAGMCTEAQIAKIAAANRLSAGEGVHDPEALLQEKLLTSPLRQHACPRIVDGAAAMVLATAPVARAVCDNPIWIRGLEHRIETPALGVRDITKSESTTAAARAAGAFDGPVDIAELHASYAHQELILRSALELSEEATVNASGGALLSDPVMATGLIRIGECASQMRSGAGRRGLAHASSGPCLQHNLVCVLESDG